MTLTLSVLIPAYNEEHTITEIIQDILEQKNATFKLDKIIVITDGCTDATAKKVRALNNPQIQLIENKERRGKVVCLKQAKAETVSDIIVQVDADTKLGDTSTFEELIKPFYADSTIGLTCAKYLPFPPTTYVSRITILGLSMYNDLKDALGDKAIRYRCNGRLLALRGSLARSIEIKSLSADDVYIFYAVVSLGHSVAYCPKAVTRYRVAQTWREYINQHTRYMSLTIGGFFPTIYKKYDTMTFYRKAHYCLYCFFTGKYPRLEIVMLMSIYFLVTLRSYFYKPVALWKIAQSTKQALNVTPN